MNTVTIQKSTYDLLNKQARNFRFLNHYRPSINRDREESGVELIVGDNGLIDTLRYGETLNDAVNGAISDIVNMQEVYWIYEESEVYAGNSLECIINEFFSEEDKIRILREGSYGSVDLDEIISIRNEETGLTESKTIKLLLQEIATFPALIITAYG